MDKRNWMWFILTGVVVLIVIAIGWFFFNGWNYGNQSVLSNYRSDMYRGGMGGDFGCFGGWGIGWFRSILFLVIPIGFLAMIAFAIIFLIRGFSQSAAQMNMQKNAGSALSILQNRYARGEITREQYQEMYKDLQHTK